MPRQLAIIPSGCQVHSKFILHVSDSRIIYASPTSLYILNGKTFNIDRVITVSDRPVSSFIVSPHDSDLIIVADNSGMVKVWKISDETVVKNCNTGYLNASIVVQCDPFQPGVAILLTSDHLGGSPKVSQWEWNKGPSGLIEITTLKHAGSRGNSIRFNPHVKASAAIGLSSGIVLLLSTITKSVASLAVEGRSEEVVDIQWDRLSSIYLLAAYSSFVSLWDTEQKTEINKFDKQPSGISSVSWLDWTAGNFVTSNVKTGLVKVWNASQKQPLEIMRAAPSGVHAMALGSGCSRAVCACVDGSISVFDLSKEQMEFQTAAGHTETIFDCRFSPTDANLLATTAYDSTVKLWCVSTLKLVKTLYADDGILYCCDFTPNGSVLAACSVNGTVILWDVDKGTELSRYLNHTKAAYGVSFNPQNQNVFASSSGDGYLVVAQVDLTKLLSGEGRSVPLGSRRQSRGSRSSAGRPQGQSDCDVRLRFQHSFPIFGSAWCVPHCQYVSTGCQDGVVRIFDYLNNALVYVLKGHSARVFNTVWSPLIPGRLATGSDDQVVMIWQLNLENVSASTRSVAVDPVRSLVGHTSNVRALCWSTEHKSLLLSGSWDSSIRMWDVDNGSCVHVLNLHSTDVYAIAAHPDRPFTFASCSRDTTVRLWELDGVFAAMKCVVAADRSLQHLLDNPTNLRRLEGYDSKRLLPLLSGAVSMGLNVTLGKELAADNAGDGSALDRQLGRARSYYAIYGFFGALNGSLDLLECVIASLTAGTTESSRGSIPLRSVTTRRVLHERDVVHRTRTDARVAESVKMARKSDMTSKAEESLRRAITLYTRIGDFKKCCDVYVDLGDWTQALALAPAVSLDYWRALSLRYGQHLHSKSSERCVQHYLAAGGTTAAVNFHLSRDEAGSALVVAKAAEAASAAGVGVVSNGDSSKGSGDNSSEVASKARALVVSASQHAASRYLASSSPVLAAAQLAAASDIEGAVALLSSCGEHDLAFALCDIYSSGAGEPVNLPTLMQPQTHARAMAEDCAEHNISFAVHQLLRHVRQDADRDVGLLLSRHCRDAVAAADILAASGLRPLKHWADKGRDDEELGSDADAVISYVIGRQHARAAELGVSCLKRCVREPLDTGSSTQRLLAGLKYIDLLAAGVSDAARRSLLCYLLWFGAHEAAAAGAFEIGWSMLRILRGAAAPNGGSPFGSSSAPFPISSSDISYQELFLRITAGDASSYFLMSDMIAEERAAGGVSDEVREKLRTLRALLRDETTAHGAAIRRTEEKLTRSGQATLADVYASDSLELLQSQTDPQQPWGPNTPTIFREVQRFGDALSLPSLARLHARRSDPPPLAPVVQGAFIPCRRPFAGGRAAYSFITQKPVRGEVLLLFDGEACVSVSERAAWKKFMPYCPLLTGEVLR